MHLTYLLSASASLQVASAYALLRNFPYLIVDGKVSEPYEFIRSEGYDRSRDQKDYSTSLSGDHILGWEMRCGVNGKIGGTATKTAKIQAGREVGFETPLGKTLNAEGPMTAWLSKSPGDIATYDGSGDWFKIWNYKPAFNFEEPELSTWFPPNTTQVKFDIPPKTPPGQYLLRLEQDQVATTFNVSQRWVQCAQLDIEGPGGGTPRPLTQFPDAAVFFDRGIWIDIGFFYEDKVEVMRNYKAPGGPVWKE